MNEINETTSTIDNGETWAAFDQENTILWGLFSSEGETWTWIIDRLKVLGEMNQNVKDNVAGRNLAQDLSFVPIKIEKKANLF